MLTECRSCGSTRLRHYAPSRRSGQVVVRCRSCGVRALSVIPDLGDQSLEHRDAAGVEAWVERKREGTGAAAWNEAMDHLVSLHGNPTGKRIFDIGAGDGEFLAEARKRGYQVTGNEITPGAVVVAKERYGIDLYLGDISTMSGIPPQDVVTMWCVLAHVVEPDRLLQGVHDVLRPGGVLVMQTPHWGMLDRTARMAHSTTGGRASRLLDRRVGVHHIQLNTKRSITKNLERAGFEVLSVTPRARYTLKTGVYLTSLGVPPRVVRPAAKALDALVEHELMPRIVLDVYARRRGDVDVPEPRQQDHQRDQADSAHQG